MDKTNCQEFMKRFFEQYYEKLCNQDEILVKLPGLQKEMWADDVDPKQEWKKWKLVPSAVTQEDLDRLEKEIGTPFPTALRVFLSTYYHYFETPVGRNPMKKPFEAVFHAWNPMLVKAGYLPFTWDQDGYYIRCIDLHNMPDEEKCGIYQIDHEILFDFEEDTVSEEEIRDNMEFVSDNLFTYLEELLEELE